jgi:SAM-dependent methyltransferase
MNPISGAVFDKIASRYDAVWSDTPIGRVQRSAVWNRVDPLFKQGDLVLDLGCGTGVDALHLQSRGVSVYGIDSSPRMVEIARARGADAYCYPIERLRYLDLRLDGALSNFGALNCVASLSSTAASLARMVRSGGYVALCFMNTVCLWEMAFYLLQGRPGKAFRRLPGRADSSLGARVSYPSHAAIVSVFGSHFRLVTFYGIGVSVPPSYVTALTPRKIEWLATLDRKLTDIPGLRSLADHRLYIFERI